MTTGLAPRRSRTAPPTVRVTIRWAFSIAVADRKNRSRLLVMALGTALCALVMLALVSLAPTLDAVALRSAAAVPVDSSAADSVFDYSHTQLAVGGVVVRGTLLHATVPAPPPPPGADRFPADGELVVSPALATLLADPASTALRELLPGTVIGTLDPATLGATDLVYYRGVGTTTMYFLPSLGWGVNNEGYQFDDQFWIIVVTGVVIVMVPLLLFTALAARIGTARRDRRNTLLRMLGASSRQLRTVTAAEAVIAAVIGIGTAVAVSFVIRPMLTQFSLNGLSLRTGDIGPDAIGWIAIIVGAPFLSVLASLTGTRTTRGLNVVRRRLFHRARWRVLLVLIAIVGAFALPGILDGGHTSTSELSVVCAIIIVDLFSLAAITGPIAAGVARLMPGRPAARMARGRILRDPAGSTRAAAALATVLAGSIALISLLAGYTDQQSTGSSTGVLASTPLDPLSAQEWRRLEASLLMVDGVDGVGISTNVTTATPNVSVGVANCETLTVNMAVSYLDPGECIDGAVYRIGGRTTSDPIVMDMDDGSRLGWTPGNDVVALGAASQDPNHTVYLLTPAAAQIQIPEVFERANILVTVDLRTSDLGAAQLATAWLGIRGSSLFQLAYPSDDYGYAVAGWARTALIGCGLLVLLICALGQWLIAAEQIAERRRAFALARADGVPLRTLSASVLLTVMIPVLVGLLLATGVGALLAQQIQLLRRGEFAAIDGTWIAGSWGVALTVTLLIAAGSILQLRRTTGPDALRTE